MAHCPGLVDRRAVLRAGAAAAASYGRILGANDTINAALIGCGSRGTEALLPGASFLTDLRFVAACDVYKANLEKGLDVMARQGHRAAGYGDYRRVLDRTDVEVVFIATPDHWHAPLIAAACEAGKDVYCEKPLANTIEDCKMALNAARKHDRVVQVGLQQRSMELFKNAADLIQGGAIGRIRRGVINWNAESGGPRKTAPERPQNVPVPEGLDWQMWQGRAPRHAFDPERFRSWRTFWDYGSGAITDLAVHMLDVFHWYTGENTPAITYGAAYSLPGRPEERTPEFFELTWKYDQQLLTYSSRGEGDWGIYIYGDLGMLHVNRQICEVKPFDKAAKRVEIRMPYTPKESEAPHIRNFLDCVRSRRRPNSDIGPACRSTVAGLLAAMSVRSGKSFRWDGDAAIPV